MSLVARGLISGPLVTWGLGLGLLIAPDFICPEKLTVYRVNDSTLIRKFIDSSVVEYDSNVLSSIKTVLKQVVESKVDSVVIEAALDQLSVQTSGDYGIISWLVDANGISKVTDTSMINMLSDSSTVTKLIDRSSALNLIDSDEIVVKSESITKGC